MWTTGTARCSLSLNWWVKTAGDLALSIFHVQSFKTSLMLKYKTQQDFMLEFFSTHLLPLITLFRVWSLSQLSLGGRQDTSWAGRDFFVIQRKPINLTIIKPAFIFWLWSFVSFCLDQSQLWSFENLKCALRKQKSSSVLEPFKQIKSLFRV